MRASVTIDGVGLFTGAESSIELVPAREGHGILFQRSDLPGMPVIPGALEHVVPSPRCTTLANEGGQVQTVEHLLSALRAFSIDHLTIRLCGPEVPIGDGSSQAFVEAIQKVGVEEIDRVRPIFRLRRPVIFSHGDIQIIAVPADELRCSYTLHYPQSPYIRSQFYSFTLEEDAYCREIAPCRTFCLFEEVESLMKSGVLKGGGIDTAVVVRGDEVLNPEGVRFRDEMVRHKILDLLGDLSLMEIDWRAHIIAIRSGHAANVAFAKLLRDQIKMENGV